MSSEAQIADYYNDYPSSVGVIDKLNEEYSDLELEKKKVEDYYVKQMKKLNYQVCIKYISLLATKGWNESPTPKQLLEEIDHYNCYGFNCDGIY